MGLIFQPPRVPLTDPRTGLITREWYAFFQAQYQRVGGSDGSSTAELEAAIAALSTGEMLTQPAVAQSDVTELLMQPSTQTAEFGDVMQPTDCGSFNEMILQG